jgi:hypothetical protein
VKDSKKMDEEGILKQGIFFSLCGSSVRGNWREGSFTGDLE